MTDPALRRGDRIAQFTTVGRLGAGGMGEVYRAHDERRMSSCAEGIERRRLCVGESGCGVCEVAIAAAASTGLFLFVLIRFGLLAP